MKKRSVFIAVLLMSSVFLLTLATPALADSKVFKADFEEGVVPNGWITSVNPAEWNPIIQVVGAPSPVHSGRYSLQESFVASSYSGGSSVLQFAPPAGGEKYQLSTWVYRETDYDWGMTSSVFMLDFPGGSTVGMQMGTDYFGIYTGTGTDVLWGRPEITNGVWHNIKVIYDREHQTMDFLFDGVYVSRHQPVDVGDVAPQMAYMYVSGGWAPGNGITQYLDDISVKVSY